MLYTSSNTFSRIAYKKHGTGPVIVLLHGFPADHSLWDNIYPGLSSFTTIIPDFPGVGESLGNGEHITIDDMAACVHTILQGEQISAAVIVGHSMGGYVAAAFAEKYPSLMKGMSMVHSTTAADDDERRTMRKKVIELIRKGGKETFIRQMIPNLFAPSFRETNPEVVERQVKKGLLVPDATLIGFYAAMMVRPDRYSVLENTSFPVQWILGKEDGGLPYLKILKQSTVTDINFVNLYSNCGHMSMIENPAQLANDIACFAEYSHKL